MTVKELHELTAQLIEQGHGDSPVMFDTEAQTFHYHMASVDVAHHEDEPEPHLGLHEDKPHHTCTEACDSYSSKPLG
jgi:hypothetical protein